MITIKSGSELLYQTGADRIAISAKLTEEINTFGSLDMVLDNPQNLTLFSPVEVYDDDGMKWRGRVLTLENGFTDTRKTARCEGALAFLNDTVLPPFVFRGTSAAFFTAVINNHNSQLPVNDPRRFTLGTVSATDVSTLARSSQTAMSSWEAIKTRLLDLRGGYIYLSGDDLNVINYVDDYPVCDQTIHFGENLVNLIQTEGAESVATLIYAYGATNDQEHTEPEPTPATGMQYWNGNRVHLDGPVTFDSASWQAYIDRFGYVYATATFDDCTTTDGLTAAADQWLVDNMASLISSIEITAADLSINDPTIDELQSGKYVRIICEPLNLDVVLVCIRKESDLLDMSQTRITIGRDPVTISGMVGG